MEEYNPVPLNPIYTRQLHSDTFLVNTYTVNNKYKDLLKTAYDKLQEDHDLFEFLKAVERIESL